MKYLLLTIMILCHVLCISQDVVMNSYELSPTQLNPALNGTACGVRLSTNMQKVSINKDFYALRASVDAPVILRDKWSLGIGYSYVQDVFGDSNYGAKNHTFSTSMIKKLGSKIISHRIALGLEGGLSNRSLNGKNLRWPSQIGPNGFDNTQSIGEDPALDFNILYKDINIGLDYIAKWQNDNLLNIGIAFNHINQPNISFLGNAVPIKTRAVYYLRSKYMISTKFGLAPTIFYTTMNNQSTYFASLGTQYAFVDDKIIGTLTAGYQKNNQPFVGLQIRIKQLSIGANVTISDEESITRKFETSLTYTFGSYACD
jgi:hypothetical protein